MEVDNLLQWVYNASATAIDQHLRANAMSNFDAIPSLQLANHGKVRLLQPSGYLPSTRDGTEGSFRIKPISRVSKVEHLRCLQ